MQASFQNVTTDGPVRTRVRLSVEAEICNGQISGVTFWRKAALKGCLVSAIKPLLGGAQWTPELPRLLLI